MSKSPTRRSFAGWTAVFTAVALLLVPAIGAAKPDLARAKAEYRLAKTAFERGAYPEALVHYQAAYKAAPLPGFQFNIGQCHRNLEHYREAVAAFRLYLREKPRARNRRAVTALIRKLERQAARQPLPVDTPPDDKPVEPPDETDAGHQQGGAGGTPIDRPTDGSTEPADDERPAGSLDVPDGSGEGAQGSANEALAGSITRDDSPPPPRSKPFYKRWWFWTAVVAVAGAGAAGIYFGARAGGSGAPASDYPLIDIRP